MDIPKYITYKGNLYKLEMENVPDLHQLTVDQEIEQMEKTLNNLEKIHATESYRDCVGCKYNDEDNPLCVRPYNVKCPLD